MRLAWIDRGVAKLNTAGNIDSPPRRRMSVRLGRACSAGVQSVIVILLLIFFGTIYLTDSIVPNKDLSISALMGMGLLVLFVLIGVFGDLQDVLFRIQDSGVRRLSYFGGLTVVPWSDIRYVHLGGLRCRLEHLHHDYELGTVDFNQFESPADAFAFISSRMRFESHDDARPILDEVVRELDEDTPAKSVRFLARSLELFFGFLTGSLLFISLRQGEELSETYRMVAMGCVGLVIVVWRNVAQWLRKKWPKLRLTCFF